MEHFYHFLDGWFDFQDVYSLAIKFAKDDAHFVEIGTYKGMSAAYMIVEIINSKKKIQFDTIDNFKPPDTIVDRDEIYNALMENLKPVKGFYNFIEKNSIDASSYYKNLSLDFVFIDGDHTYEGVSKDIVAWFPKVKIGGIIAGHDYSRLFVGVRKAVDEIFPDRVIMNQSWLIIKRGVKWNTNL